MCKTKLIFVVTLLVCLAIARLGLAEQPIPQQADQLFSELNQENYQAQVLEYNRPLIVFFYAQWCPYSGSFMPIYGGIEKEYAQDIKFCRFQLADEYKDFQTPEGQARWQVLGQNYGVNILPTLIMFNQGKELDRMSGRPEKELVANYHQLLKTWINSNLLKPQENPYRFSGTLLLRKQ